MFKNVTVAQKIWFVAIFTIVSFVGLNIFELSKKKAALMQSKQERLTHLVETAHSIMGTAYKKEQSGALTRQEAQKEAMEAIKTLRYDGENYFWINDMRPFMIMHPFKPELDGTDLKDNKDPNGKHLFVEFVKVVQADGAGFVDYYWPKPGKDKPVPKLSRVQGFAQWGWLVGSGVYIDDIDEEFNKTVLSYVVIYLVFGLIITGGLVAVVRSITKQSEEDKQILESLVENITEEVNNIKSDSEIVTDNAKIVSEMSITSAGFSGEGEQAVAESISGVERIKRQIEDVAEKILELSSQTQAIGVIISTVDDIAKQSKFLAFNASIEASKVGEHGKGFAIVASEIKNLSEESKEATKKISEILNEIQGLTNNSVMLAEDATKLADAGYELSSTAGDSISKLSTSIQHSSEAAFQITSSAMEQQTRLESLVETLQTAIARKS